MTDQQFLKNFKTTQQKTFHSGFQNWWTNFLFHYNDLHNVVSILDSGYLYSRNKAKSLSLLKKDIANDDVISKTHMEVYDYVRLYIGAKTPTLYHNEGLIPQNDIRCNAHCPVPIFLLFDFEKVFLLPDLYFSNGNVGATTPEIYKNIKELSKLEWEYIYHRESLYGYSEPIKRHITYCRNAEVLIKEKLDVYDHLKWICVRSVADKETLLYLVSNETKIKIKDKIKVFTQDGLFHNRRIYLKDVSLDLNNIQINFFNLNSKTFSFELNARSIADNNKVIALLKNHPLSQNLQWSLKDLNTSMGVHFTLKIDSNIVYDNILVQHTEILF